MTRVAYWNNIPAPYMVDRFNALVERTPYDFEAWFSARTESDRSWDVDESSWRFPFRYLPALDRGSSALALPTPLLGRTPPDVLVSLYAGAGYLAGSAWARHRGARTVYWVEVTYDAWVSRRRWKESLKSHVLPAADGIFTAGDDGRAFARRYGVADDRIQIVPHVVDFDRFADGSRDVGERDRIREQLGLRGVTFCYVGRLWSGKGLTYLIDAFDRVQRARPDDVSLLLVGDGADEAALRARVESAGVANVAWAGFQGGEMLPRLYRAADVFVFPTLGDPFGMVVLEAMACGLPVVATTASGEIGARVRHGENGFLVPPADSEALGGAMLELARDHELRERLGRAARERVRGQGPHLWARAFEEAVEHVLARPWRVTERRAA